jgi:hypothetical protein
MSSFDAIPCWFPANAHGREKNFPSMVRESSRKPLIFAGMSAEGRKFSRCFPVGGENRVYPEQVSIPHPNFSRDCWLTSISRW